MSEEPRTNSLENTAEADFGVSADDATPDAEFAAAPGIWDDLKHTFLRWLKKVWKVRGGGLYALGWVVSFLYLEATDILFDDIPKLLAMDGYGLCNLIGFAIEFFIDTIKNTLIAFMWPLLALGWQQPVGALLLLVALIVFPRYVKPLIEQWLVDEPDTVEDQEAP